MPSDHKAKIRRLLKGIETGDPAAAAVVNEAKYIQHNPQTHEGSEGLAALFKRLSLTSPRVNLVRVFEDGDYVFAHTEYYFSQANVGFEVFRFEDGQAVEHWDNIQKRQDANRSGHTMVDGPSEAQEGERSEANRACIQDFVQRVLLEKQGERLADFLDARHYIEHSPDLSDDIDALRAALTASSDSGPLLDYQRCHRILADGNFVLSVCEGQKQGVHSSFYDLFRVADGKIQEHWSTTETVPPASEWKNKNGKF